MANALSFLDQTYRHHLLVEDPRTYDYFSTLFNAETATIQIVPVGGSDGVKGLVNASWQHDAQSPIHAYGWIDRDFGTDNVSQWGNPAMHLFRGTHHEIENYLLDWDALAHCNIATQYNKQSVNYRDAALSFAQAHLYGTVCADVLYHFQRDCVGNFPSDPDCSTIASRQDVENYIQGQPWFTGRIQAVTQLLSETELKRRIDTAESFYNNALMAQDDSWRIVFPGKEIFEELIRLIYKGPKANGGGVRVPDMVKSIANYQREHGIPHELQNFIAELNRR